MRLPAQQSDLTYLADADITPAYIQTLLDQGAIISGPCSDTHDTYFFREGARYVYCVDPQFGRGERAREFYASAATRAGLADLLCLACFHNRSWSTRQ